MLLTHNLNRDVFDAELSLGRFAQRYDIFDRKASLTKDLDCKFKLFVHGPDGAGYFYFFAERPDFETKWAVTQCELEVVETKNLKKEDFQDKRLIIYSRKRDGPLEEAEASS